METLLLLLQSPAALTLIATVATALYGVFKGTDQYRQMQETKWGRILDVAEVGVIASFQAIKAPKVADPNQANELTLSEAATARNKAIDATKAEALKRGIDLDKMLTPEGLQKLVHTTYESMKSSGRI
jgi:hypothetical protein